MVYKCLVFTGKSCWSIGCILVGENIHSNQHDTELHTDIHTNIHVLRSHSLIVETEIAATGALNVYICIFIQCFSSVPQTRTMSPRGGVRAGGCGDWTMCYQTSGHGMYTSIWGEMKPTKQTRDVDPMLFCCWADVENGGTTLKQN